MDKADNGGAMPCLEAAEEGFRVVRKYSRLNFHQTRHYSSIKKASQGQTWKTNIDQFF